MGIRWGCALHFENDPHALRTMRKVAYCLAKAGGATHEAGGDVEIAVGEALGYVGYEDEKVAEPMRMDVEFDESELTVLIRNELKTMPRSVKIPRSLPESQAQEFRLYIAGLMMDAVELDGGPDRLGVSLRMSKRLA